MQSELAAVPQNDDNRKRKGRATAFSLLQNLCQEVSYVGEEQVCPEEK